MQYFVVMIDYGRRGREAIVVRNHPARGHLADVSGEYKNISFIHEIANSPSRISPPIFSARPLFPTSADGRHLQASHFDHLHDLRKHESSCDTRASCYPRQKNVIVDLL